MAVSFRVLLLGCAFAASPAFAHGGHMHIAAPVDAPVASKSERQWLAGDHHIHSEFSADYQADAANPAAIPTPLFGKDGRYSIRKNAEMARTFGLSWCPPSAPMAQI